LRRTDNSSTANQAYCQDLETTFDSDSDSATGVVSATAAASASDEYGSIAIDGSATVNLAYNQAAKLISTDTVMNVSTSLADGGGYASGKGLFNSTASFSPENTTTRLEIELYLVATGGGTVDEWGASYGDDGPMSSGFGLSAQMAGWWLTATPQVDNDEWYIEYVDGENSADDYTDTVTGGVNEYVYDEYNAPIGQDFDDDTFTLSSIINLPWDPIDSGEGDTGELYGFSAFTSAKAMKDD
jgi:hypothetical protein